MLGRARTTNASGGQTPDWRTGNRAYYHRHVTYYLTRDKVLIFALSRVAETDGGYMLNVPSPLLIEIFCLLFTDDL